jgi:hypothetical protein
VCCHLHGLLVVVMFTTPHSFSQSRRQQCTHHHIHGLICFLLLLCSQLFTTKNTMILTSLSSWYSSCSCAHTSSKPGRLHTRIIVFLVFFLMLSSQLLTTKKMTTHGFVVVVVFTTPHSSQLGRGRCMWV